MKIDATTNDQFVRVPLIVEVVPVVVPLATVEVEVGDVARVVGVRSLCTARHLLHCPLNTHWTEYIVGYTIRQHAAPCEFHLCKEHNNDTRIKRI